MKNKRLYFDIETSPNVVYSWRVGRRINLDYNNIVKERAIICICYKWEDKDEVHSLKWDNGCDKKMLKKFVKVADKATEIVGHNSDRFDIKWVRGRLLYHRIPDIVNFTSIDTLKDARSRFLLNSNRLDYIGQYLGVGEKMETGGFQLWVDVMEGDDDALQRMIDYCKQDVLLLEKVYKEIEDYTKVKSHLGVLNGGGKWSCPRCSSNNVKCNKTRTTRTGIIRREMLCHDCKRNYTISNKSYMDFIQWKLRNGQRI